MTTINGTAGNDTLVGDSNDDSFYPDGGKDTVTGGAGNDTIYLSNDTPELSGTTIDGGAGRNTIVTSGAVDLSQISFTNIQSIQADNYHATLIGTSQLAGLSSLVGRIEITGSGPANFAGIDITNAVILVDDSVTSVNLTGAIVTAGYQAGISLGNSNVTFTGGEVPVQLYTGNGNDSITAGSANDSISIGSGTTSVQLGNGNDIVSLGTGLETVNVGSGNDTFYVNSSVITSIPGQGNFSAQGPASGSVINGGSGSNTLNIDEPSVDLNGVKFTNIQTINAEYTVKMSAATLLQFSTLIGSFIVSGTSPILLAGKTFGDFEITLDPAGGTFDATGGTIMPYSTGLIVHGGTNGANTITTPAGGTSIGTGGLNDDIHVGAGNNNITITSASGMITGTYDVGAGADNGLYISGYVSSYDLTQAHISGFQSLNTPEAVGNVEVVVKLTVAQLAAFTSTVNSGTVTLVDGGSVDLSGVTGSSYNASYATGFQLSDSATNLDLRGFVQTTVTVHGGAGGDTIYGMTSSAASPFPPPQFVDKLYGGAGNDTLEGSAGSDYLDGGSGVNTAIYTGNLVNYRVDETAADGAAYALADERSGSPDGVDTLVNIQHLQFADTMLDLTAPVISLTTGGQVLVLAPGQTFNLSNTAGSADTVGGSGGTVNFTNADASVSGNNDAVTINSNAATVSVLGTSDTVAVIGSGVSLTAGGNGNAAPMPDTITLHQGGVVHEVDGSRIDVLGSGATVAVGNSDTLGLYGGNETVNASGTGDVVWIGANGQYAAVSDAITLFQGGAMHEVDGSRVDVLGSGATASLGNSDTLGIYGSSETVNASGTGDVAWIGANGQYAAVSDTVTLLQGGAVHEVDGSRVDVLGSGATVTIGHSDTLGIYGGSETVSASGTGDVVWIGANGQSAAVSDTVTLLQGGSVHEVDGSRVDALGGGASFVLGANDTLGAYGTDNAFTFGQAIGHASLWGFGATDQITLSKASFGAQATGFDYWAHLLGDASVSGGTTTIKLDGSDSIVLQNYTLTSANQSQFHFA